MSQGPIYLPVAGVYGGLAAANYINAATASLNSCWLGSSAPSIPADSIPAAGQGWIDTSTAGYYFIKRYDGSAWMVEGVIDTANDLFLNPIGGGIANIASAATCDLNSKPEACPTITGTTTISSFGSNVPKGQMKILTFGGSLQITYNATSMILPGAANITTAAGDCAIMQALGSGNWKCIYYGKISGAQLSMTGASATVASATTTDLASGGSNAITVSGTTTITGFGSNATLANPYYFVRFSGALILTHNGTSLILPGAQNITTAAGDFCIVEYLGSGNWRVNDYQPSDGAPTSITGPDTTVASAATTNLGAVGSNLINITGTTTITAFGSSASTANPLFFIRFTGALILTYNATSLILPGSGNITTTAGDAALFQYLGSGNWRCLQYMRIDGTVNGSPLAGFRNSIINGGFNVWQRGTTYALTTSPAYGTADRWWSSEATSAAGIANRSADATGQSFGCQYNMKLGRTAGSALTNQINLGTSLETVNSIPLAGRTVTLSFYAFKGANFSASGNALNFLLYTGTGTNQSGTAPSGWTGSATPLSGSPVLTGSWQRFSYTVTLATTVTQIGLLFYWNGVGTAGADDNAYITGVQLELGPYATPFELRPFATELALCQRYFEKSFAQATAPATALGVNTGESYGIAGKAGALLDYIQLPFKVTKRTAPTMTYYNPVGSNSQVRDVTAGGDCSSTGTQANNESNAVVNCTGNAATAVGNMIAVHWTANSEL